MRGARAAWPPHGLVALGCRLPRYPGVTRRQVADDPDAQFGRAAHGLADSAGMAAPARVAASSAAIASAPVAPVHGPPEAKPAKPSACSRSAASCARSLTPAASVAVTAALVCATVSPHGFSHRIGRA